MRAIRFVTRAAAAAALLGGAMYVYAVPAWAQAASGLQDSSGIQAGATNPGDGPRAEPVSTSRRGGRGGPRPTCTAADGTVGPVRYRAVPDDLLTQAEKDRIAEQGGSFTMKFCGDELAPRLPGTGLESRYVAPSGSAAPAVDPGVLATQALERAPLPEPQISMAPSPDIPQLVNFATYLWLPVEQWQPESVSATAGGVTSTVTATPVRVIWDMGQGDTVTCDGPGLSYRPELSDEAQPSDCHYSYPASSAGQPGQAFTVTATVEWETTWSVSGAPGGGSLGTLRRSSSTSVQVAELQSLNVVPQL